MTDYRAWVAYFAGVALVAALLLIGAPVHAEERTCVGIETYTAKVQDTANEMGTLVAMAKSVPSGGIQKLAILFPDDTALLVLFKDDCLFAVQPMSGPVVRVHVFAGRSIKQIFGVNA